MNTVTAPTSLSVNRLIRAPRARVFAAWITPADIAHWLRPDATCTVSATVDARVGGEYVVSMKKPDAPEKVIRGIYREVTPPEKLVFTWGGGCGQPLEETLVTVDFVDKNGATEVRIHHERFSDPEICERHNQGWTVCLDNIEKLLGGK